MTSLSDRTVLEFTQTEPTHGKSSRSLLLRLRSHRNDGEAVAEGAREAGAAVDIKRVPETGAAGGGARPRTSSSIRPRRSPGSTTSPTTTRLSSAPARASVACLRRWRTSSIRPAASGPRARCNGKVGGAFTSTATQHGGQETTLFSIITNLLHFGMVVVGLDYGHAGQMRSTRSPAARPMAPPLSPAATARASPAERTRRRPLSGPKRIAETAIKLHG